MGKKWKGIQNLKNWSFRDFYAGDLYFDCPPLQELEVYECPEVRTFIAICTIQLHGGAKPAVAQSLVQLEELVVLDCPQLGEIVGDDQGEEEKTNDNNIVRRLEFPNLKQVSLDKLPRLEYIFKHSSNVSLCNLKKVFVGSCDILKKYLFQPAVAQSLVQLEELKVRHCPQLEEIVGDDEDGDQGEEEKTNDNNIVRRLEFPNLKQVDLYNLPELRGFCCSRGDLLFDWPSLERLEVVDCPKMTTFARTSSAGTPKLRSVQIDDPSTLWKEEMISHDLTCLEELYMEGRTLSWDDMNIARNLPRLKVLKACTPDIETMPPDFVFPHQLETFCITLGRESRGSDWDNHTPTLILHEIVKESAYVWRGSLTTLLTKYRELSIWRCRKMDSIFPDLSARAEDLKLLTHLYIRNCDEFRSIINTSTTTAADAGHQQFLLSSLEYLWLFQLPRLEYIFKHSSSVSLCNLKHVIVRDCCILKKYMFQPAVAQSLVQLEELRVSECPQLGEIVGDDEDGDQGEEEKKNDNNIVRRLEFPNLKQVGLLDLPELRGFCCSRGDLLVDWPSLEYLRVSRCPKMTTFARTSSAGTLSTPKLKSVVIGDYSSKEMIPQGMDLNQFLLMLQQKAHGGGAEEIHTTSDT